MTDSTPAPELELWPRADRSGDFWVAVREPADPDGATVIGKVYGAPDMVAPHVNVWVGKLAGLDAGWRICRTAQAAAVAVWAAWMSHGAPAWAEVPQEAIEADSRPAARGFRAHTVWTDDMPEPF